VEFQFDKQRISQVFVNLLSNALKFTFHGYIKLSVKKISEGQEKLENDENIQIQRPIMDRSAFNQTKFKILFAVEDTGIGIKEEDHEKLFKIFGKVGQNEELNP
jgi:signal transduction histidine kinase